MEHEEQFRQNLSHAFALLHSLLATPEAIDYIPEGAQLIVMPSDNPDLREANLSIVLGRRYRRLERKGDDDDTGGTGQ